MTSKGFVPLKSYKPITTLRQARLATSEFHHGGGDRSRYQTASALLTDVHKTSSKFVFRTITKLGKRPKSGEPPLETFEVGAVNTQLIQSPFLNVYAIDVKSRNSSIKEVDFFDVPIDKQYDVLVLAMVLNCVETADKRGEMLLRCRLHMKEDGLFFLVLPTRCFPDGKEKVFEDAIMRQLGFQLIEYEDTAKVCFFCFKAVDITLAKAELKLTFSNHFLDIMVCAGLLASLGTKGDLVEADAEHPPDSLDEEESKRSSRQQSKRKKQRMK